MHTVVLAASKGGAGKTTLAAALSALAAQRDKAAIADLDPQRSLSRWLELRAHFAPDLKSPTLYEGYDTIAEASRQAQADGMGWLFIDTPPALISTILPAIVQSDLVLIPAKPSLLDLEAVDPIVNICRDYQKPFEFVITMVAGPGGFTDIARKFLTHEGKVLSPPIASRQLYATAMVKGGTAAEADKTGKSAEEIKALWRAIRLKLKRLDITIVTAPAQHLARDEG